MRMDDIIRIQQNYPDAVMIQYKILGPDIVLFEEGVVSLILLEDLKSYEVEFAEAIGITVKNLY